jgi:hypothetical protein
MVKTLLGAVFATSLLAGSLAFAAGAQGTATTPQPAASPQAASENWPPCSKTVRDRCIEVNKRLNEAYPACAKIKNRDEKANCVETAFKEKKGS